MYNCGMRGLCCFFPWITDSIRKKILEGHGGYLGETWNIDEQKIKAEGKWLYSWNILDKKTRFLIANTVTQERSLLETQQVFKKAKKNTNNHTPRMIVSDKMQSYKSVIKNECPDAIHIRAGIKDPINNNKLERFHGTWRERDKVMRGLEQDRTTQAMLKATKPLVCGGVS